MSLVEAAKNYDVRKGASFATYAGIRVRGTMIDEVRKNDWLPRSVYRNSRTVAEAVHTLENELGREARDQEVADYMRVSLSEYHKMLSDSYLGQLCDFEEYGINETLFTEGFTASIDGPLEMTEREAVTKIIAKCITTLPDREGLVLALYYDEELNLKEIGAVLSVSESRVCQILSQAMQRLRSNLPEWEEATKKS